MKLSPFVTATLMMASGLAQAALPSAHAVYQFGGADKASPASNLVLLPSGDFVGMTAARANGSSGAGTIYQLSAEGQIKALYSFATDGSECAAALPNPKSGALMQASDGNFYGVCAKGGTSGNGAVFQLTASGGFTVLHSFSGADGSRPIGALTEGLNGNLYGVTLGGGVDAQGGGTVFQVTKQGAFTTLYDFDAQSGPANPQAGLALGPDGNLYGAYEYVVANVGIGNAPGGSFEIDSTGNVSFPALFQSYPYSCAPVIDAAGTAYALNIPSMDAGAGSETLEAIPLGSKYANIDLNLPTQDGAEYVNFSGCMMQGSDGRFYANGISEIEKPSLPYAVVQMDSATQTTSFFNLGPYGHIPVMAPQEGVDGKLYIANAAGGRHALGNVVSLDYGIAPPAPAIVAFAPGSGSAGTVVTMAGRFYVGVVAVTLNGKAVSFQANSSSAISFTVPQGATSGAISVTTSTGNVVSASTFIVQ